MEYSYNNNFFRKWDALTIVLLLLKLNKNLEIPSIVWRTMQSPQIRKSITAIHHFTIIRQFTFLWCEFFVRLPFWKACKSISCCGWHSQKPQKRTKKKESKKVAKLITFENIENIERDLHSTNYLPINTWIWEGQKDMAPQ